MDALAFFSQTFGAHDLAVIGLLIVLEGVLSIDNALVLGLLAKRLPKAHQSRALTYGLVGAFVFRIIAIATASFLLRWRVVKLLGGAYLVYIAIKHLFFEHKDKEEETITTSAEGHPELRDEKGQPLSPQEAEEEIRKRSSLPIPDAENENSAMPSEKIVPFGRKFWSTVFVIEMTDIAFAIDSILAAIALVGAPPADHPKELPHPKLWVVITGGMLGVILMRYAAVIFIKLLEKFPRFETAAYLLVIVIGGKLLADWGFNTPKDEPGWHPPLDFHSPSSPAFWVFWVLMIICFCIGFLPSRKKLHLQGATH